MFNTLARSVVVGAFSVGAVLGAAGIASAHPHGGWDDDEYFDEDLPAGVVVVDDSHRSKVQFEIQVATSDLQNAENVR